MGFIKRWLIKKALKKQASKSDIEKIADDVLKSATLEMAQTGRLADKILKAKLMRQESQNTLSKIRELDEEIDDGDEPEEPKSMEEMILPLLMGKLLGGGVPAQPKGEPTSFDEKGNPVYAQTPEPTASAESPSISEIANKLKPEDIEALKKKFGF